MSESKLLTTKIAEKYGIQKDKLLASLLSTAFRSDNKITEEQMISLLVVADQYNLNPFTKEIYAFPGKNGITPVVGVDGWLRIINDHPQLDGISFAYSDEMITPDGLSISCPSWIEVTIHRKDRKIPTTVREYFDEVYQNPHKVKRKFKENEYYFVNGPWQSHPKRMLRHKGLIQCARVAFSLSGIYDEDEANRIVDMGEVEEVGLNESPSTDLSAQQLVIQQNSIPKSSANERLNDEAAKKVALELIDRIKQYNSWAPAYEYVSTKYDPETQKRIIALLKKAEQEQKDTEQTQYEDVTLNVQPAQPSEPVQPQQSQPIQTEPVLAKQPSYTEGLGF